VVAQSITSKRRMFEITRCKCPRCVAGRRNLSLAISGVCVVIALAYFTITDRRETLPDYSSLGGSAPLVSAQNVSGSSEPLATAKRDPQAIKQPEPVAAEKLPDSSPGQDHPLDSTSLNPETTILDENLAMVYSSHPFGVLPSWLGEREFAAPWRPQGGPADEVVPEPGSANGNRPGPAKAPSELKPDRPIPAGASPSGQAKEAPEVAVVHSSQPIQPPARQLEAPEPIPASASKPVLPPRSKLAKYRKRE
jgi:hypothetical protein